MQGKEDGKYVDSFSAAYVALKTKAPANMTFAMSHEDDALTEATTTSIKAAAADLSKAFSNYITCAKGHARRSRCPPGQLFNVAGQNCTASGSSSGPASGGDGNAEVPSTPQVAQFCAVKPDGIYMHPFNNTAGLICSMQKPHPFACPEGFIGRDNVGCTPADQAKLAPSQVRHLAKQGLQQSAQPTSGNWLQTLNSGLNSTPTDSAD